MRPKSGAFASVAVIVLLTAVAPGVRADEPKQEPAPPQMSAEEQAMMEKMMAAGVPGEPHAWLSSMAGSWEFSGTFWMGPGGTETQSTGTIERSMALGGRVLVEKVTSEFEGQPFEGHGMLGYDNVSKQYWGTWNDNMMTGIMTSWGSCEAGKCEFQMKGYDPMTGEYTTTRGVSEHTADREVHTAWAKGPDGKEWKTMELVYTRKK